MENLPGLIVDCRRAVERSLAVLRTREATASSRAHQIKALTILRTLDAWTTRTPFPEQPPRLARLARDLAVAVLGESDALATALRQRTMSTENLRAGGAVLLCLACRRCEPTASARCTECSAPLTSFPPSALVDGRFVLTGEIGRGAMGVVSEALDIFLERLVALKLITADTTPTGALLSTFRKEATALAAVRNDHVVQVYAFGVHAQGYYLAMERVVGRDLGAILDEHRAHRSTLPVPLAVTILGRVAAGLAAVHEAGLVHRDVKPSNIVIEERTGRAVLVDFGLALRRPSSGDISTSPEFGGTPLFLAPELIGGGSSLASGRWNSPDLYALGCIAFEVLTGCPPFRAKNIPDLFRKHLTFPAPRVSSIRPTLSAFDDILARLLAKDPVERPESGGDVARGLEAALRGWLTSEPSERALPTTEVRSASSEVAARPEAARVLVVDDDPVFQRLATRCAELAFFECPARIETVGSSEAAVASAARAMPDLVLLDYGLPGEDGITTLTRLRRMPGGDSARVVVVSGSVSSVERWRFQALGVEDFCSKPVRFQGLVDLIAEIALRAGWQTTLAPSGRRDAL